MAFVDPAESLPPAWGAALQSDMRELLSIIHMVQLDIVALLVTHQVAPHQTPLSAGTAIAAVSVQEVDLREKMREGSFGKADLLELVHATAQAREQALEQVGRLEVELEELRVDRSREESRFYNFRSEILAALGPQSPNTLPHDLDASTSALLSAVGELRDASDILQSRAVASDASAEGLRGRIQVLSLERDALAVRAKASEREVRNTHGRLSATEEEVEHFMVEHRAVHGRFGTAEDELVQFMAKHRESEGMAHIFQGETESLRAALTEAQWAVGQLESENADALRREQAWRSDLAERVHGAFMNSRRSPSAASPSAPSPSAASPSTACRMSCSRRPTAQLLDAKQHRLLVGHQLLVEAGNSPTGPTLSCSPLRVTRTEVTR